MKMLKRARALGLVCLISALAATMLAACGGDDSDSTGETTASSADSTTETKTPSGEPFKVLVTSFVDSPAGSVPEVFTGAEVAAENINEQGGIAGRPVEIVTCNGKADPKAEVACARKGVEDGVIASDSNVFVANPEGALEVLDRGNVADVAGAGGAPANFTFPNTYPIEFNAANGVGCVSPEALTTVGSGAKLGVYAAEQPFAEGAMQLIEPAIDANPAVKSAYTGAVSAPVTTQDFGPIVQQVSDTGANYVLSNAEPAATASFITAAASAGKKWSFCADGGLVGPELAEELGPLSEGIFTSIGLPPTSTASEFPMIQQFVDEMTAANEAGNDLASLKINEFNSMRSWLGLQAIAQVAETIDGEITADSFSKAIANATVDLDFAQIDFSKPQGAAPFERVFQPLGYLSSWNQDAAEFEQVAEVNLVNVLAGK